MNAEALEEIRQNLEAADFLSDSEKEMFFDILLSWPEGSLPQLLEALRLGEAPKLKPQSPVQAAVPKPAMAPVNISEGTRVEDLRKFLSSKTISFKPDKPVAKPAPHKVTVDDVLKPPPSIKEVPGSPRKLPSEVQAGKQINLQASKVEPPKGFFRPIKIDDLSSSEELGKLSLTHLRQGDFSQNLKKIVDKVLQIAQKESILPYTVIAAFEKSPVNQLFIETGLALMDDISKDRSMVFGRVENIMKNERRLAFNSEEFHAFTDFKIELEKLL